MKVLDPIFNFVQDHILLVLSPLILFVVVVVPTVLILQFLYDQKRIVNALARKLRHLGLEPVADGLKGSHLHLDFQWSRFDTADILHVEYIATLPEEFRRLSLSREGYKSGLAAQQGASELLTGDVDFDDYFWIESADLEVLTPQRRALLLDVFPKLSSDADIVCGRLSGRVRCEQSPLGVSVVVRMVEQIERLRRDILDPPVIESGSPVGWVGRQKRRQASVPFWLLGLPLFLTSSWLSWQGLSPLGVTIGLMLSGILLCSAAFSLWVGWRSALPLARCVQLLGSLAILSTAPLWLEAATPLGILLVAALAIGSIYGLHLGYAYLTRLRLE